MLDGSLGPGNLANFIGQRNETLRAALQGAHLGFCTRGLLSALFPLTPALSLGEREHGLPTQEHSRLRSKMFTLKKSAAVHANATRAQKLAMLLPLPLTEGKGRVRGESMANGQKRHDVILNSMAVGPG